MPGDIELTEEQVDDIIRRTAEKIHVYRMETVAILTLESVKPLVYIGGEMSRLMLTPFLPALGPDINALGENLINVFEDRNNIEKLLVLLEEMAREDDKKKEESEKEPENGDTPQGEAANDAEAGGEDEKKREGWRSWLPF
ncbi:hypothetical protein JXL21_01650 [Candidatus Bathyarchaeota archaeon]|nr:hypothetical protein [Candidatus Bathyarchaeota archaeon]